MNPRVGIRFIGIRIISVMVALLLICGGSIETNAQVDRRVYSVEQAAEIAVRNYPQFYNWVYCWEMRDHYHNYPSYMFTAVSEDGDIGYNIWVIKETGGCYARYGCELTEQYVFENSDEVYLLESDLYGLSKEELRLAINEIYAKEGRIFQDDGLSNYFNSTMWYRPTIAASNFSDNLLNEFEKYNVGLLLEAENNTQITYQGNNYQTYSEWLFYDSSMRYLNYQDLINLSPWELKVARNEIYARKGRMFQNSDLQAYFNAQSWYYPRIPSDQFSEDSLSDIERKNVEYIISFEEKFQ